MPERSTVKTEGNVRRALTAAYIGLLAAAVAAAALIGPFVPTSPRLRSAGIRYYCGRVIAGEPYGELFSFTGDRGNLAGAIIANYLRAGFWVSGSDIRELDECFLLRWDAGEGETEDYFVYKRGDQAYVQQTARGMCVRLDAGLYGLLDDAMGGRRISFPIDYWPVFDFPDNYSAEQALRDGVFLPRFGMNRKDTILVIESFLSKTARGEAAEMMAVKYGIDSPPAVMRVVYDGERYLVFEGMMVRPPRRGGYVGSGKYTAVLHNDGVTRLYVTNQEDLQKWEGSGDGIWIAAWRPEE